MSLLAWYPMAGYGDTLQNQGLSNGSIHFDSAPLLLTGNGLGDEYRYVVLSDYKLELLDEDSSGYNDPVYEFSFCSWIKIILATNRSRGLFFENILNADSNTSFGLCLDEIGSDVSLWFFVGSQYTKLTSNLSRNQYIHLAVTYSAGVLTTYVNGSIINTTSGIAILQQSGIISVCGGGLIEVFDIRYYNECISKLQAHDISLGLFTHIPLNDIFVTNAAYDTTLVIGEEGSIAIDQKISDCSGFGHNIVCVGSRIDVFNNVKAVGINCPRFDGSVMHSLTSRGANNKTVYNPRSNFTVAFFATLDDHDGNILISASSSDDKPWSIRVSGEFIVVRLYTDSTHYKELELIHMLEFDNINTMRHLAFTFDGDCLKTYKDGHLKSSYTFDLPFLLEYSNGYLSGDPGFVVGYKTTSRILDYRVYGTVLSEEEIGRVCDIKHELDDKYNAYSKCFYEMDSDSYRQGHNDKGVCFTDDFYNHTDNYDLEVKRFSIPGRAGTFLKIFSHNCRDGGVLFSSVIEAMNCNTQYKFSALGRLGDFCFDGKYEFILRYPEDEPLKMNWWTQTSNPTTTTETVSGYTPISISWLNLNWGGLAKSSGSSTYLKGSIGNTNWYYAIGAMRNYMGGIPSWAATMGTVELWVRVPDKYAIWRSFITANNFIEI